MLSARLIIETENAVTKRSTPAEQPGLRAVVVAPRDVNLRMDLAAPGVRKLKAYQPGKPISELEREYGVRNVLKLASNENVLGPSPLALEAVRGAMSDAWLYPDGSGYELEVGARCAARRARRAGSRSATVPTTRLVLLAEAFLTPEVEAIYSQYAFAVYPIAAAGDGRARLRCAGAPGGSSDGARARSGRDGRASASVRASCSSPIRTTRPAPGSSAMPCVRFLERVPAHALVVIDEALQRVRDDPRVSECDRLDRRRSNVVVTRTSQDLRPGRIACEATPPCRVPKWRRSSTVFARPST